MSEDKRREYLRSHPWITFGIDLTHLPFTVWMRLGEAGSKAAHLSSAVLAPRVAAQLNHIYLTKGALATTAIEGNTLSEAEAEQAVVGKLHLPPSQEYLAREIENIVKACNEIVHDAVAFGKFPLTIESLCRLNRLVLDGLEIGEDTVPGELRSHGVTVGNVYRGAPAQDCEFLLNRLLEWLEEMDSELVKNVDRPTSALLCSCLAHLYIAWIHPFGDGNGRTARLVEFALMVSAGIPVPAAHLLSDHYNRTRTRYYRELDRASKSGGDVIPWVTYALEGFVDGIRAQLERVTNWQLDIAWQHFVSETMHDRKTTAGHRQKVLAIALTVGGWVGLKDVPKLSAKLANEYAGKSLKTVARDVNALVELGLIQRHGNEIHTAKQIMLAFRPTCVDPEAPPSLPPGATPLLQPARPRKSQKSSK